MKMKKIKKVTEKLKNSGKINKNEKKNLVK